MAVSSATAAQHNARGKLGYSPGVAIEAWQRDRLTLGGGEVRVVLIALAAEALPDPLPVSRGRHGVPDNSEGVAAVSVCPRHLAEHLDWFEGFRSSGLIA